MDRAFRNFDLLLRAAGDTLILMPPLIVSEAQIGEIVTATRDAAAVRAAVSPDAADASPGTPNGRHQDRGLQAYESVRPGAQSAQGKGR